MTIVAKITVPARMGSTLAVTMGNMLTARSRTPGLSEFVALALLFQSWRMEGPCALGQLFGLMRAGVFSPLTPAPLDLMQSAMTYLMPANAHQVSEPHAASAVQAARNMAESLKSHDIPALQQEADSLVYHVLSEKTDHSQSLGRALLYGLHEQISNWNPELGPTNAMLLGESITSAAAGSTPASSEESDVPVTRMLRGPISVLGLDGQILGQFSDPQKAIEAAAAHTREVLAREQNLSFGAAEKAAEPALDPNKPSLRVYDRQAALERLQATPVPSSPMEGNIQQYRLLDQMAKTSGVRALTEVPDGNPVEQLYVRFPHFTDVLDFVSQNLALAGCGDEGSPVRIPPMLLRGGAGVGKTYFAQELARVLQAHFIERDLSVSSAAFVFTGSDATYKGSKPGIVFDALVNGKTANPVILLNEIDKARSTGEHNSPMAALYALLEPTSAARFVDEFVPVEIDASRVVWICTANDGDIPDPILSRLEVFDIRQPTPDECRLIAASVWKSICEKDLPHGHGFAEELDAVTLDFMANISPRVMRKALLSAAGAAARDDARTLYFGGNTRYAPAPAKQGIGFLPTA